MTASPPPPPPPRSTNVTTTPPPGMPPLPKAASRLRAPAQTGSAVAITESLARVYEPVPSRRRWWLVGWLVLGLVAAVVIGFALARNGGPDGSMPDDTIESGSSDANDESIDTDESGETSGDDFDDAETNVVSGSSDDVDSDSDSAGDDAGDDADPIADSDDQAANDPTGQIVADPDFEPSTSINPPVTLEAGDGSVDDVADSETADDGIAPSRATVRNGQIYFEGAVPSREQGDELVALAVEILGEENVFDNYVVDPRAGDPSVGNITVDDTINFDTDGTEILPGAETLLNQGLALMNLRPDMTVTIVGHTDGRGVEAVNARLSLARAESVKAWFVERGIAPERLTTEGAGGSEPIASDDTLEGREENRRIEFILENVLGA